MGFKRPVENFKRFRDEFQGNLFSIELGFDGKFYTDSEIKITGGPENLMWQKERLLNLAIATIPRNVEYIGWVDSDLLFYDKHMVEDAERLLMDFQAVQLMRGIEYVDPKGRMIKYATAYSQRTEKPKLSKRFPGGAWAVRREVADIGLIDSAIVGGGDCTLALAWQGDFKNNHILRLNLDFRRDCLLESLPHYQAVQKRISCCHGIARHLFHGDVQDRQYHNRHEILTRGNYNPATDVFINHKGVWEWTGSKPQMQQEVKDYFLNRMEDGNPVG